MYASDHHGCCLDRQRPSFVPRSSCESTSFACARTHWASRESLVPPLVACRLHLSTLAALSGRGWREARGEYGTCTRALFLIGRAGSLWRVAPFMNRPPHMDSSSPSPSPSPAVELPAKAKQALEVLLRAPDMRGGPEVAAARETFCRTVGALRERGVTLSRVILIVEEVAREVGASSAAILPVVGLCADDFSPPSVPGRSQGGGS